MQTRFLKLMIVGLVLAHLSREMAQGGTRLSLGGVRGYKGVTVSVPLTLFGDTNVVALQADVVFDPTTLFSDTPTAGAALGGRVLASSEPAAGVRRILVYSLNNTALGNGVLANLPFAIASNAPVSAARLLLTDVILATAQPLPVASTEIEGAIVINPLYVRPDGDVDFFFSATAGQSYWIQASTTLTQWINLSITTPPGNLVEFTDTNAHLFPYRFYRLSPSAGP